ncbi:MAG: hypothetical protein R3C61_28535 [Bacteroidia bacterium]
MPQPLQPVFYELDSLKTRLTGVPGTFYDGDTLILKHMPTDFTYGFQIGLRQPQNR